MRDEEPKEGEEEVTSQSIEYQMFLFRKMVVFCFVSIIVIIVIVMASVILWVTYKGGNAPTLDSMLSLANTVVSMFDRFLSE